MQPIRNSLSIPTTYNQKKPQKQVSSVAFKCALVKDVLQIASKPKKSFNDGVNNILAILGIKCVATSEKLQEFQKTFKKLFLREDISIEETKNIIKNYQKISKIKDDREFLKAIFKEIKSNFGFKDIDLSLEFIKLQKSKTGMTIASSNVVMSKVFANPNLTREKGPQVIYHELRHTKQNYLSACYDINVYVDGIIERLMPKLKKEAVEKKLVITENTIEQTKQKIITNMTNRWGTFSKDKIPKEPLPYAERCLKAHSNYVSPHENIEAYKNNFLEYDAYTSDTLFYKIHKKANKLLVRE